MYPADGCRGFSLWDLGGGVTHQTCPPAPLNAPRAVDPKPVFRTLGGMKAGRRRHSRRTETANAETEVQGGNELGASPDVVPLRGGGAGGVAPAVWPPPGKVENLR